MMDDPEGVIDTASGTVRKIVKLHKETVAQFNALKKAWATDDSKVKSILTLSTKGEANQIVTSSRAPGGKAAYGLLLDRYGNTSVAQSFNTYNDLINFKGASASDPVEVFNTEFNSALERLNGGTGDNTGRYQRT